MSTSVQVISGKEAIRRYRTQEQRRRIVEETLSSGASVATVARAHGVNANQLFHWRKLYRAGLLEKTSGAAADNDVRLLPVVIQDEPVYQEEKTTPPVASSAAAIHIEFPGHAYVSVVGSADPVVIRAVLESLRA